MICMRSLSLFDEVLIIFSLLPENLLVKNDPIIIPITVLMAIIVGTNLDDLFMFLKPLNFIISQLIQFV